MGVFFRRSRGANSIVGDWIWPNFEHLQALMHVLVTCKYKKDWMKNERVKVVSLFSPIITLWELSVAMETRVLDLI